MKISAILPIKGRGDWNDLLCSSADPVSASKHFNENLDEYQFQAKLALAATANEYANLYLNHTRFAPGLFAFKGCYFFSWIKKGKGDPPDELYVTKVSDFTVEVLHAFRSDVDEDRPVFTHRMKVIPKGRPNIIVTADAENLKSPDAMKGFFLKHGRSLWTGQQESVNGFIKMVVQSPAPVVRQLECIGYDHKTGFHVLRDVAFDPKGKIIFPKVGLFDVGRGNFLRPPMMETIKPGTCNIPEIYNLLTTAWGNNGAVAMSFLFASIFVNQVKADLRFFPFLSMHGDPQTGKSRLLTFLNHMQGLNEEGLVMTSANTKKGELRELSKVSGLMKGMIEGNDTGKARFDFESVLPLYNYGNPLQVRAIKSNDSRTHELPFYGTLAFCQNIEPFKSRAAKERVISLKFSCDDLNAETKQAFESLSSKQPGEFASFLPEIFKRRETIEQEWRLEHTQAREDLMKAVPDNRICENHAVILGFHRLFCKLFNIDHDLKPALEEIGKAKMIACRKRTLTPADHFFDALDQLPEQVTGLGGTDFSEQKNTFCLIKDGKFCCNRPKAEEAIRAAGITLDYPDRLGASLQEHPAFLEANKSVRFGDGENRKAWVFDIEKIAAD